MRWRGGWLDLWGKKPINALDVYNMRFKLAIKFEGKIPVILPVNYQYPLSAWIYKTIHNGNNEFAAWLHE